MDAPQTDEQKEYQAPPRTNRQHVLPLASIIRFRNAKDVVEVELIHKQKRFTENGNQKNFVAIRAWTQFAEDGMRGVEDAFQNAINEVLVSKKIDDKHQVIFKRFYALIRARSKARYTEIAGESLMTDVSPMPKMTDEELLEFERQGVFFENTPLAVSRQVKDFAIAHEVLQADKQQGKWGLITSAKREFLVSDDFFPLIFVPVNPTTYLVWEEDSQQLGDQAVQRMNAEIKASARNFVFARSLDHC
ncbi:hypothetical protein SAMN05192549_1302 [Duganella sacchari]|uniref:DUF4238 domain-containing protein n=1 Tax=Duganella sacchari TaxID=551987 RepID=A0A1M7RF47_9BURK|nr:hypothetical protein [Duganella sacchari]SHN44905.1 hypothetical protein SAMN05192549_1302 [Duganella sacchari]